MAAPRDLEGRRWPAVLALCCQCGTARMTSTRGQRGEWHREGEGPSRCLVWRECATCEERTTHAYLRGEHDPHRDIAELRAGPERPVVNGRRLSVLEMLERDITPQHPPRCPGWCQEDPGHAYDSNDYDVERFGSLDESAAAGELIVCRYHRATFRRGEGGEEAVSVYQLEQAWVRRGGGEPVITYDTAECLGPECRGAECLGFADTRELADAFTRAADLLERLAAGGSPDAPPSRAGCAEDDGMEAAPRQHRRLTVARALTVDGLVAHFAETGAPTVKDLWSALVRLGRNAGPALLSDLDAEGLLTREAAAATVGGAWSASNFPDRCLGRQSWRALFALAGYTRNGVPAERPTEPLTLYRGAVPEHRADWSWTDRVDVARGYAEGARTCREAGKLWQAVVEPWRLLARNDGPDNRDEAEYVVDTDGLTISEGPGQPTD